MPRGFHELRNAEAVDLTDPESLRIHERSKKHQTPRFPTSRGNGARTRQQRRWSVATGPLRVRPRSFGETQVSQNDFHGFRYLDTKHEGFQELNIAGKGVKTDTQEDCYGGIEFQNQRLFFPDIALVKPFLVTNQTEFAEGRRRKRMHSISSVESPQEEENVDNLGQTGWSGRKVVEKDRSAKKIFIKVVLPKIT